MRLLRIVITALLFNGAVMTNASAADGYRYWSYWQSENGAWTYAKLGPAMLKATDGAVDGWRYGIGTTATSTPPSARGDFDAICGGTTASTDQVRVAVVIDYGNEAAAPTTRTACAVIAKGLTRASALAAVAQLRLNQGFVCGIDNFPATGCGESTSAPTPTRTATTTPTRTATTIPTSIGTDATATPTASATASADAEPATEATTVPVVEDAASNSSAATPTASATPAAESDSALPTVVTFVLGAIALIVALRNARLQQAVRRR